MYREKEDAKRAEEKRRKILHHLMTEQAKSLASDMVLDYVNRPIANDRVDLFVPAGKIDDPKLQVTHKVEVDPRNYVMSYLVPADVTYEVVEADEDEGRMFEVHYADDEEEEGPTYEIDEAVEVKPEETP